MCMVHFYSAFIVTGTYTNFTNSMFIRGLHLVDIIVMSEYFVSLVGMVV